MGNTLLPQFPRTLKTTTFVNVIVCNLSKFSIISFYSCNLLKLCLSVYGNTILPQFPRTHKTITTFVYLIILICISSFYSNNLLILCMSVCGNTMLPQFPRTLKTTTTFVNLIIFNFYFFILL